MPSTSPGIPPAVDPGTPVFAGVADPVPAEPAPRFMWLPLPVGDSPPLQGTVPSTDPLCYGVVVDSVNTSVFAYVPVRSASLALMSWRKSTDTASLLIGAM